MTDKDKTSRPADVDENYVIATPKREKKSQGTTHQGEGSAASGTPTTETGASTEPSPKSPKRKKHLITLGVVVAVIIVAGAGFMAWHETPSFCGAICHSPMDPYMPTYYSEPGETGVDKWGNTVEDSRPMLSAEHRAYADMACMDCHVPSMEEQITEGMEWIRGDYYYPLNERDLNRLVYYRGVGETEFCLNESCHNMTKSDLTEATSECVRNPHSWHHNEYDCSDCHKAHRASVMVCSQCHQDYELPEGWITWQQAQELDTVYGQYEDLEADNE